jgi:hypothetical protein
MAALALLLAACGKGTLTGSATHDAGQDGGPRSCNLSSFRPVRPRTQMSDKKYSVN